ncbi:MAG: co-chaperone DjlA [Gammaproteobacteria bacterium]
MFHGSGGFGGGFRGGNDLVTFVTLAAIAAIIGFFFGEGIVKVLILAGVLAAGRVSGFLSTAYCLRAAILVAASMVVFWGAKTGALIAAIVIASSWHFWSESTMPLKYKARRRQEIFFDAIFSLLGYIAKADGAVCAQEINFAAGLMTKMQLNAERIAHARELFRRGKEADFDIDETLRQVQKECRGSIGMFIRILANAAAADGDIGEVESRILHYVGNRLGLSAGEVEQIEAAVRGGANRSQSYGGYGDYDNRPAPRADALGESYEILGVHRDASNIDIRRSYRRLMSRHHPDKLAAKGMPPEMMRVATERAQEISSAYESIKKARGI